MVGILLAIELFDELVYGAREAAWPLIRADLGLSYLAVGALMTIPGVVGSVIEPAFGLLADTGRRRALVFAGGVAFLISLAGTALAWGFVPLLLAFTLMFPASGAFVGLSEAALMEVEPGREERNLARWTLAGSVGVVAGPLVLAGALAARFGWRGVFIAFAVVLLPLLVSARRSDPGSAEPRSGIGVIRAARAAMLRPSVLRWLLLLQLTDLMGDVLLGFLAIYLVDVGGLSPLAAALGVGLWTAAGLAGDALLLPVLARMPGVTYLRVSALAVLAIYPAFLLATPLPLRLALLALLGASHAGWYSVPKARLFAELPGSTGVAVALSSAASLLGYAFPLVIGLLAERYGLAAAMWLPLLAPVAVLVMVQRTPGASRGDQPPSS